MLSPEKKKIKLADTIINKPVIDSSEGSVPSDLPKQQILKFVPNTKEEKQARKRKNFITACELVSHRDYFDHRTRLLLVYLPSCTKTVCAHRDKSGINLNEISSYIEEAFETEMKSNMWYEALELCNMCITSTQYLSANVLKDIVEIMLNAHEDEYAECTVKQLLDKCQQTLMLHFSIHPPCIVKSIRNCYNNFLTSPMSLKENTFSDRNHYECHKGIVKYCLNRLEYELSIEEDGPLIDKRKSIPEEMKNSVRGLYWQKEKCDIFECLNRQERIERLFTVLESVIELLQFDLAVWHSRYTNNLGRHIMRSHKPLMAYVLWSKNVLYTGAVTNICRQILRIFTEIVRLNYPSAMVKIITLWLNTMIQTFYICESNSNTDYPNTSKYCNVFAKEFYIIISDLPSDSTIRVLERIEPSFMRHLIGLIHISEILSTRENCIIKILINFLRQACWKSYQCHSGKPKLANSLFPKSNTTKNRIRYLLKKYLDTTCLEYTNTQPCETMQIDNQSTPNIDLNHIVHSLYITLEAYLNAFDIQSVQETWSDLNEQGLHETNSDCNLNVNSFYSVTESLIKKYRNILQSNKELVDVFSELIIKGELPEVFNIFKNIGFLES